MLILLWLPSAHDTNPMIFEALGTWVLSILQLTGQGAPSGLCPGCPIGNPAWNSLSPLRIPLFQETFQGRLELCPQGRGEQDEGVPAVRVWGLPWPRLPFPGQ